MAASTSYLFRYRQLGEFLEARIIPERIGLESRLIGVCYTNVTFTDTATGQTFNLPGYVRGMRFAVAPKVEPVRHSLCCSNRVYSFTLATPMTPVVFLTYLRLILVGRGR